MKRLLLAALIATGCGEEALPAPQVVSISPDSALASNATAVSVKVDGVLPTSVNYDQTADTVDPRVSLLVGTLAVGTGSWEPGGTLNAVVPSLLAPGAYDVQVSFADGRTGVLSQAFKVARGNWPTSYTVSPIAAQHAGVPFTVELEAQGPNGATFEGNVTLQTSAGGLISPSLSAPFSHGRLSQTVTLPSAAAGVVLMVADLEGHIGRSKAFDVLP